MRVFTNRFWLASAVIAAGLSPAALAQTPAPLPAEQVVPDATAVSPFTPAAEQTPAPVPPAPVTAPPTVAPAIPITVTQSYVEPSPDLEVRIAALEANLKKKQDKPDSKKAFTKTVSGRVYFDSYNVMDQSGGVVENQQTSLTNLKNWNGVRDARIGVSGEGYEILDYTVDLGFTQATGSNAPETKNTFNNNGVNFKDVSLGVKNVPLLEYVRIGHYRIEDGLSHLVGGTNTTFLEFADRDFALSRRIGISSRHLWAQDRLRLFTGIFFEDDFVSSGRFSQRDNQGTITNIRLTYMPYASRDKDGKIDGKCFTLFGGNYSYIDVTKKSGVARADWQSRFDTLDIGRVFRVNIDTGNYQKFGLEFAKQNGPFTLQAEAFFNVYENAKTWSGDTEAAGVDLVRHGRTVSGGYIMARYFLTGDFRKFNANNATWGAASLNHNLDLRKICDRNYVYWTGAWELAARWSYVDLTDLWNVGNSSVTCGDINTLTVGLNWYWSPQARWMFDYSHIMPNKIRNGNVRDASTTDLLSIAFRYNF
ncbi:MAG: hypothetical protein LBU65_10575 [Planctomycetaceae bacterium]|nr:hypothetical protein [Planctomycetaceae bacterium]